MTEFEFQRLSIYHKAKTFHLDCREVLATARFDRYYIDQLGRASLSISLNIAEGSGKFGRRDRRNYFVMARSSVFECAALFDVLKGTTLVLPETADTMILRAGELSRMLYTMIKNLEEQN